MDFVEFMNWTDYKSLKYRIVSGKMYKNRVEVWSIHRPDIIYFGEADRLEDAFEKAHDNHRQNSY